jgi:hypothetical protein
LVAPLIAGGDDGVEVPAIEFDEVEHEHDDATTELRKVITALELAGEQSSPVIQSALSAAWKSSGLHFDVGFDVVFEADSHIEENAFVVHGLLRQLRVEHLERLDVRGKCENRVQERDEELDVLRLGEEQLEDEVELRIEQTWVSHTRRFGAPGKPVRRYPLDRSALREHCVKSTRRSFFDDVARAMLASRRCSRRASDARSAT